MQKIEYFNILKKITKKIFYIYFLFTFLNTIILTLIHFINILKFNHILYKHVKLLNKFFLN